jgi:hypothetical protein
LRPQIENNFCALEDFARTRKNEINFNFWEENALVKYDESINYKTLGKNIREIKFQAVIFKKTSFNETTSDSRTKKLS